MSRGITTSVPAFASNTVAESLSTAHVKTSLAPGCTLTTKSSVRRAQDTNSLSVFFSGGGLPRPFVSTKVGLIRAGFAAANTATPTFCERDFAVVALAATLDVTVDSESSTQPAVQRVLLDPFSRGPAVTFLAEASELSHVAAHTIVPNTNDQGSATMFHRCMRSVRAQCFHDNK